MAEILLKADFINKYKVELIVTSDMKRALSTVDLVFPDQPRVVLDFIKERGVWESETSLKKRCEKLTTWLVYRPEKTILVCGHGKFFRSLLNPHVYFGNCALYRSLLTRGRDELIEWGMLSKEFQPEDGIREERVPEDLISIQRWTDSGDILELTQKGAGREKSLFKL